MWGSRTQQHAYCLRYSHSQHIESHLGKKQQQAKIPIAFLFSQLHFNNVTSHALFYGGHLVMHSKRCAVQNQGITLNTPLQIFAFSFTTTSSCLITIACWVVTWTLFLLVFMVNARFLLICIMLCILSNKIQVPIKGGSRLTLFVGKGVVRVKQWLQ